MQRPARLLVAILLIATTTLTAAPRFRGWGAGRGSAPDAPPGHSDDPDDRSAFAPLVKAFHAFDRLDRNRDGVLDATELAQIRRPDLRAQIDTLDHDRDGNIRRADIRIRTIEMLRERAARIPAAMIAKFDTNGDGSVSIVEARQAGARPGVLEALAGFDRNGDQRLAGDELQAIEGAIIGLVLKPRIARLANLLANGQQKHSPASGFLSFVVDGDGDGQISPAELEAFLDQSLGEAATPYALGRLGIPSPATAASPPAVGNPTGPFDSRPAAPPRSSDPAGKSSGAGTTEPASPPTVTATAPANGPAPRPAITTQHGHAPSTRISPPAITTQPPPREILFPNAPGTPPSTSEHDLQQEFLGSDAENDLLW